MPNLDDMRIAAKSLRRLAELMEADIRKEEGVETKHRTREEVNALGGLVAEYFWKRDELKALRISADRRGNDFYDRATELQKEIYDLEKQLKERTRGER